MSELKKYIAERLDLMDVYEVRTANGGIDYFLKIDGTYSDYGSVGMLQYHREEFRRVLKSEGLTIGVRSFDS